MDRPQVPQDYVAGARTRPDGRSEAWMVAGRLKVIVAVSGYSIRHRPKSKWESGTTTNPPPPEAFVPSMSTRP